MTVNGDTKFEGDEYFFVNLSSTVNAGILDSQGVGMILNDDPAPTTPPTLTINNVARSQDELGNSLFSVHH